MKKPYRLRWESKFFVRAIIFGVLFFTLQLVLNYLNTDKIKELDMVFWNSFFTLAMTYCAYVTQIVYSDFKEINPDKARQCQIHRPQNHKVLHANRTLCSILISRDSDCDWNYLQKFNKILMKPTKIILAITTLVAMASCTQTSTPTCIVEGNLTGLEGDGWIYMTDMWNDGEVIDSTEYHDGVFRFEVSAEEPTMVFLHAGCFARLHKFFNDPGIITLTGSAEDARKARVGGTPMNDYLLKMESKLNENMGEQSLLKGMEACRELYTSALEENAGNALSVRLMQQSTEGFHPSILLEYINQLEPYLKEKAFTKELNDELERLLLVSPAIEGCDVKPYYIDMEYPDVNGNMIKLSDVVNNPKNRYVYIDFWATWCGPCRMYMESLAKTYEKYKDNGFEVYTVSCDTNTEVWKKLVAEKDFGWIDVIGGMSMPEWKSYVVTSVPTSILIDCSTGLIIGRELYEDMLDAKLEMLL